MTRIGPATADRWAVSTRSDGDIQTVGTSLPGIQLGVLGVPQGFTADEIRNWLRDLAGVALETSRTDPRPRPIPQVLHHALTGLLFSQSELWRKTGQPVPLSAVFMDDPNGLAFGWVGQARVTLRVNGLPHEPRWVLVRDADGQEAVSTRLPAEAHVTVMLEYRPNGEDGSPTTAWLQAEWGTPRATAPVGTTRDEVLGFEFGALPQDASIYHEPSLEAAPPIVAEAPFDVAPPVTEAVVETPAPPLPDSLPTAQPGLVQAPDAFEPPPTDRPSTFHPSASTFMMPRVPALEPTAITPLVPETVESRAEALMDRVAAEDESIVEATNASSVASVVDSTPSTEPPPAASIEPVASTLPPPALWTPTPRSTPPSVSAVESPAAEGVVESMPPVVEDVTAAAPSTPVVEPVVEPDAQIEDTPAFAHVDSVESSEVVEPETAPSDAIESGESSVREVAAPQVDTVETPVDAIAPPEAVTESPSIASAPEAVTAPVSEASAVESATEPKHPVAMWLSRLLGRNAKPAASEPVVEDTTTVEPAEVEAPVTPEPIAASASETETVSHPETVQAPVADETTSASEATPSPEVATEEPFEPAVVTPDGANAEAAPVSSYDALLSTEELESAVTPVAPVEATAVPEPPTSVPARPAAPRFGLAPVGLAQVMRVPPRATAASAPSPAPAPSPVASSAPVEPEPPAAGTPPSRLAVVREPVGADPSFGIPRVPQREPARPVAAPKPEPLPWRSAATPPSPVAPEPVAAPVQDVVEVTPVLPEPPVELLAALAQAEAEATPSVEDAIVEPAHETPIEDVAPSTIVESESVTEATTSEPVTETETPTTFVPSPIDATNEPPIVVEVELDDDDDLGEPMLDLPIVEPIASALPENPEAAAPSEPIALVEPVVTDVAPVVETSSAASEVVTDDATSDVEAIATADTESSPTVEAVAATATEPETVVMTPAAATEPIAAVEERPTTDAEPTPVVATVATEAAAPPVRSHHWPSPQDLEVPETPVWRQPWLIAAFVAVLFGIGWWLGHQETRTPASNASPLARALSAVGLGGAHFALKVESDPPGAWIAIDGKDTGQRTPATFNLKPGLHRIRFSLADLGSYQALITGSNGQDRIMSESLHGNLEVRASNPGLPVRMALDGQDQGFLPVSLTKLPPGLHQMQFSGPDLQPWAQTVNVPIRGVARVEAQPVITPATGVLQVQATLNDDAGAAPLKGASVYIDGELRGRTPLKLELARGPHSLRVTYDDERAPVQVIDLPGGNERFATFAFGIENDLPPLRLQGDYSRLSAAKPVNVTATLEGMAARDVREAHLHVKGADGLWRRLDMTTSFDARGVVVSAPFPVTLLRGQSRTPWYVSVSSAQGDEFFTEIQRAGR